MCVGPSVPPTQLNVHMQFRRWPQKVVAIALANTSERAESRHGLKQHDVVICGLQHEKKVVTDHINAHGRRAPRTHNGERSRRLGRESRSRRRSQLTSLIQHRSDSCACWSRTLSTCAGAFFCAYRYPPIKSVCHGRRRPRTQACMSLCNRFRCRSYVRCAHREVAKAGR